MEQEEPPVFTEQDPGARHGAEIFTSLSALDPQPALMKQKLLLSHFINEKLRSRDVWSLARVTGRGTVRK